MRLVKNLELDNGMKVDLGGDSESGMIGMIPIFTTKEQAKKVYGEDVLTMPVGIADDEVER